MTAHIDSNYDAHESHDMNQLTVKGFDDELDAIMRRLARQEGISLNQAALKLLREGAGLRDNSNGIPTR